MLVQPVNDKSGFDDGCDNLPHGPEAIQTFPQGRAGSVRIWHISLCQFGLEIIPRSLGPEQLSLKWVKFV